MPRHIDQRILGNTGVALTALGFGTAPLGELFSPVTDAEASRAMEAAWGAGLRYFDTSPFYGHGKSEIRVGRALAHQLRSDFVLSTKVGRLFHRPADPTQFLAPVWKGALPLDLTFDYSRDGILRSVEDSYLRLGMNTIDLLLIHDLDAQFHPDPAELARHRADLRHSGWRALEELKAGGVIQGWGAGINTRGTMRWFLDTMPVDFFLLALRYTLLEHDTLEDELPLCEAKGVGLVIGGVFNSGILATGPRPGAMHNYAPAAPDILARVVRIEAVCASHAVPLTAAALQFPLGHPLVASVIPGALTGAQVAANVAAMNHAIPPVFWSDLKAAGLLRPDAPIPMDRKKHQ